MRLADLLTNVPAFHRISGSDQIKVVAWHLHVHGGKETFNNEDLRVAFREAHYDPPDVSVYLPRMAKGPQAAVLKVRGGYKLGGAVRRELDAKYGQHPTSVAVTDLLAALPTKVPNLMERAFLLEALNCYKVRAYRAATVMAWNLAFDHVRRWVLKDAARLIAFNNSVAAKYPKKGLSISVVEHFEDLKESEVLETLKHAGLVSDNIFGILKEKLNKRNRAAHPSNVEVTQHQADDSITDLVNNVVLALL